MSRPSRLLAAAAFGLALLAALPARAELTARQVIDEWVGFMARFDQRMSWESERSADGAIELRGVSFVTDIPGETPQAEPAGQAVLSADWMRFEQVGGDRVAITAAPTLDLRVTVEPDGPGRGVLEITGRMAQEALLIEVTGSSVDRRYVQTLERMTFTIDRVIARGIKGDPAAEKAVPALVRATIDGSEATYSIIERGPDMFEIGGHSQTGRIDVEARLSNPDNPLDFMRFKTAIDGIEAGLAATLVPVEEDDNPFARGLAADVDYTTGASETEFEFANGGQTFALSSSSEGGELSMRMSRLGMAMGLRSEGASVSMRGSDIPVPELSFAWKLMDFGFDLPFARPDVPVNFKARAIIEALTLGDQIWAIADPNGALPHDPATARIRLSGTVRWLQDLLAADAFSKVDPEATPLELDRLEISEITLEALGAKVESSGAFTFDNTDTTTFDGMPRPQGRGQARATGLRALIDKLVAMGLLPPDAAMGFGAMLGAFTRPTDDPDTVTSEVEITPEGQVVINGLQVEK